MNVELVIDRVITQLEGDYAVWIGTIDRIDRRIARYAKKRDGEPLASETEVSPFGLEAALRRQRKHAIGRLNQVQDRLTQARKRAEQDALRRRAEL